MLANQEENSIEDEYVPEKVLASTTDYYKPEGKIFRHSKLFSNSYRQERSIFNKNIDSKQDNNIQNSKPSTVYDLGKQLLMHSRIGDSEKVQELMARGAPFSTDWLGMSALHFAVVNNHLKICDLLLRGGISKDGRTKVDRTPLHFAVYQGHESIVRLLLERKCDVNARDMLKMTPLHWAVEKGYKSIATILLTYGADVTYVSKFDKTPICIAIETGQLDLADELNLAKEQQRLEKTLLDAVQVQAETNQAVKSIISKLDKIEPAACINANNVEETMITDSNDASPVSRTTLNSQAALLNHNSSGLADKDEEIKYVEPIIQLENMSEDSQEASVLELLKSHGISMLPHDDPATSLISSALKSGRKFVLSEAGKLVLNETKLKQPKPNDKSVENKLDKLKPTVLNDLNKFGQKKNDKKPSMILKTKGLHLNPGKNVKVISVDMFKKMYGEELINSLKRIRQEKVGKHFITKITKVTRKYSDDRKNENRTNKKESPEKVSPEKTNFPDLEEDELPPNIEICIDSESEYDDIIASPSNQPSPHINEDNEKRRTVSSNEHSISKMKVYSNKLLQLNSNKEERNQKKNELPRKFAITKLPPNIKKDGNLIPILDIPEICRQLYELKKETEELRKSNEDYRMRIEKLEKCHMK